MEPKAKACLILVGVALVAIAGLLFFSFSTLQVNELGLDYSSITKSIDPTIYTPGIHFLGVGHSFIRYPSTIQTYDFSHEIDADAPQVRSRTKQGLDVELEISFQYQVISTELL